MSEGEHAQLASVTQYNDLGARDVSASWKTAHVVAAADTSLRD